jgi:putative transposase
MTYSPRRYNRRSIRLKGYDYSRPGFYFITLCVQNKKWVFGEIFPFEHPIDAEMKLNDAGKMIAKWYFELENKFSEIRCHEMVQNHDHQRIHSWGKNVGLASIQRKIMATKLLGTDYSR